MTSPPDGVTTQAVIAALSAALGAVVGAGAAELFAALNRSRERRERRSAIAFGISDKCNRMYSASLTVVRTHRRATLQRQTALAEATARGIEVGVQRPFNLSMFVRARANTAARYELTTDDLWALAQIGGAELLNAFNGLDIRYNSFQNAVDSYASQRQELMASFPIQAVDGVLATATLEPGLEANRILASLNALDEMIADLDRMALQIAADLVTALTKLARSPSRPLGQNYEVQMETADGQPFSVAARDRSRRPPFPTLMAPR